ncbi:MAG: hypothetical protein JW822_14525 [Spirochaetales bacterium]|nr:hypothetical protein [Spirochaetales bacterium]
MFKKNVELIYVLSFLMVSIFFTACKSQPSAGLVPTADMKKSMTIAGYTYKLPVWWDSVQVAVPESLKNENDVRNFVGQNYGMDTGTKKTWKQALKTWALACQRLNIFPVYLGHCHRVGEEFERAAEIFAALYPLADTQKENRDWYRVYLAYNAGELYDQLGNKEKAELWFSRAAEYAGYSDSSIRYYAGVAAKRLKSLKKDK